MSSPSERIVLALDVSGEREALAWAQRMQGKAGYFKVGLRLFTSAGPALVRTIAERYGRVFLDLKLHDIPNTVGSAAAEAASLGVSLLTVHAAGGEAMLRAAAEGARAGSTGSARTRILAVTVLTSLGADELAAGGVVRPLEEQVLALAGQAWSSGCDGFVASARETAALRARFGGDPYIVTPGIRLPGGAVHDQSRAASPQEAMNAGADALVVGRPILEAPDPEAALDAIVASLIG